MWVTQTYLRSPDAQSAIHVYYLFEDYNDAQASLTAAIQKELAALGTRYGRSVTLYMPEQSSSDKIQNELRAIESLWWNVRDRLPGLLILRQPLERYLEVSSESFYLPLAEDNVAVDGPESLAEVIQRLVEIADHQLKWEFAQRRSAKPIEKNSDLFDAIEMKPGLFGFRIDLKKLLTRSE